MFGTNLGNSHDVHSPHDIENFGDGWRFLETPSAERACKAGNLAMSTKPLAGMQFKNLLFAADSRMLEPDVETPTSEGISDASFFVGGEHHKRNRLGFYGAELGDADLPFAEYFEQDSLERMIDL